jgi:16S rRNA processing protein RimM
LKSSNDRSLTGDTLVMGEIVGVHGLRGALKVRSYADSPMLFEAGLTLYLETPEGHVEARSVDWAKPHGKGILMAITGVADRETADGLVGSRLRVDKAMLPALEEGTYYWRELIGLSVYTTQGQYLGKLDTILPTGSNDVYVVRNDDTEILVPALASVVQVIDTDQRRMEVDLPEGL